MTGKTLRLCCLAVASAWPILYGTAWDAHAADRTHAAPPGAPRVLQGEGAEDEPFPGQLSSKFRVDDRDPEASVPSAELRDKNPLEYGYFLQDVLARAEEARKRGDYQAVVRYFRAIVLAVPDAAKGWSKLCEAYEFVHDGERAIRACRQATEQLGVELGDYVRYVHLILGKDGALSSEDRRTLEGVLDHLDKQQSTEIAASHLRCEVGVKANDVAMMEMCTKVLARVAPNDPKTIVFQWSLALRKGQRAEAARLLNRAKKTGIVLANIEHMERLTRGTSGIWAWPRLIAVAALCVLAALAWFLVRRRGVHRLAQ